METILYNDCYFDIDNAIVVLIGGLKICGKKI